jgi:hypothetical protein
MKVTVEEFTYPYLGIDNKGQDRKDIVLFVREGEGTFIRRGSRILVSMGALGGYKANWSRRVFNVFHGTVTLENTVPLENNKENGNMGIKATVVEEQKPVWDFTDGLLLRNMKTNEVVLFSEAGKGTILKTDKEENIGKRVNDWNMSDFEWFDGKVNLSNS